LREEQQDDVGRRRQGGAEEGVKLNGGAPDTIFATRFSNLFRRRAPDNFRHRFSKI
jgi:hypothetical protein